MAASTLTTTTFSNSSDANFRIWGLSMHTAIIAGGWVDNGDSGQIDFSTVAAPGAISTSMGYKIYRSNDAGGGLLDFYVKLEFGSAAVSALAPAIWITVGFQGTDGAGNMLSTSNPISTRATARYEAVPSGINISINQAAGAGYICISATSSTANQDITFSVERTRNAALDFQNQVLVIGLSGQSTISINQTVDRFNAYPNAQVAANMGAMIANSLSPVAGQVGLGLLFGMAPGATSPSINIFGAEASSLGVYQDVVSVDILGVAHTYKIQRDTVFPTITSTILLTRFE